jgi:hypothetical protein
VPRGIGWTGRWGVVPIVEPVEGGYRFNLGRLERRLLMQALDEIRVLMAEQDPLTRRLFPTAYVDEPALEAEYRELVGDDLKRSTLESFDLVERTIDGTTISREELETWMRAINSARLVLGTRLDVGEDSSPPEADDPDLPLYVVYDLLDLLLGSTLAILTN